MSQELYRDLLQTWCDGLLAHQLDRPGQPEADGGLLCPACGFIHGRCADAVYPLLTLADELSSALTRDGHMILSGIRTEDVSELLAAFRRNDLELDVEDSADGWAAVRLNRPD